MLNARHSALHELVARAFRSGLPDWVLAPEVSFSIWGERGVIDILAWHPSQRAILVTELKTDIADANEMVGTVDRKRRLAARVARERGWDPVTISVWVIVSGVSTNPPTDRGPWRHVESGLPRRRAVDQGVAAPARSADRGALDLVVLEASTMV